MATRRPQRAPRWPQEDPNRPRNGLKRGQDEAKIDHHRSRESKLKPRRPNVQNLQKLKETNVFEGSRPLGEAQPEAKMGPRWPLVVLS